MDPDQMPADLDRVEFLGENLHRPECVLATADGALYVSDWRGGVTRIGPDGTQTLFLASVPPVPLQPNGIALARDRSFLIANLGEAGGVWRLDRQGGLAPLVLEIDGEALPPANFVLVDHSDRVWITVSTRQRPRSNGYRADVSDGFIARWDQGGVQIVADGLGYTNEIQFHPNGDWLYVNETFARRLSRFKVRPGGRLGPRETVVEFGAGTFPDGLCFDENGGLWITSIVSNRLLRIAPDGLQQIVLEDCEPDHIDWVEAAYRQGAMGRPHLDTVRSRRLRNISSLAFGGIDRRTGYLGCLLGTQVAMLRLPYAGVAPVHWNWT